MTFKTKEGLFECLVMPFGLFHAPTTFKHMKKDVLKPFLDMIVYLEDIFIFRKFHYEHVMCEKKILDVICQEHLLLKMLKYMLDKTSLMYMGHDIGEGELKLDLSKIDAIMDWSMLKIVIWIRGFLGASQCWRKYFVNFSSIVAHFHSLAIVQNVFQWGGKQQEAFDVLKQKISKTPILSFLDLI